MDRAIAAFYEWHYQKTTDLTAIQYLETHGAQAYVDLVGGALQRDYTTPKIWTHVLESCLVGVTEHMDDFVTTLSRVLRVAPPSKKQKALKLRSHPTKPGMTAQSIQTFYDHLTPLLHNDINLWQLATLVANEQFQMAQQFQPLVSTDENREAPGISCWHCVTCQNNDKNNHHHHHNNDPWLGIEWKVNERPGDKSSIGLSLDKHTCCNKC